MVEQQRSARHDSDEEKGAVEQEARNQPGNTSLSGQLPHRTNNPLLKDADSDFPEPGNNVEHSGEAETDSSPNEAANPSDDPGHRQKRNQGDKKDDPLAA